MHCEVLETIDGQGLSGLARPLLHEVVRAVWWESQQQRSAVHRLTGRRRCDTAVRYDELQLGAPSAPAVGLCITGDCLCRDLVVDLLAEADAFLARAAGRLRNTPGAVRSHVRTRELGDWTRRRRVATGAQARSDRIRASARARALPDEFHRALLEYLVDEAGSLAPLDGDRQLRRRLAELAAAEFGGRVEDVEARVRAALPAVEAACRRGPLVDGADGRRVTWWERYVEAPLGRRASRNTEAVDENTGGVAVSRDPIDLRVLDALDHVDPADGRDALCDTVRGLAVDGVIAPSVAAGFLADETRIAQAADALRFLEPPLPARAGSRAVRR